MRWLVCGGRKYGDLPMTTNGSPDRDHPDYPRRAAEYKHIIFSLDVLAKMHSKHYVPNDNWLPSDIEIISGMAKGADTCAVEWAIVNWCKWHEFPADWNKFGSSAGPIRNQQMLDDGKPDLVIAFPGGTGTADMVRRAEKAGVKVIKISK